MTGFPELQADWYCVIYKVFDQKDMEWLWNLCGQALSNVSAEHRERNRSQGSLVLIADYPEFGRLLGYTALSGIFDELEFEIRSSVRVTSSASLLRALPCSGTKTGGAGMNHHPLPSKWLRFLWWLIFKTQHHKTAAYVRFQVLTKNYTSCTMSTPYRIFILCWESKG